MSAKPKLLGGRYQFIQVLGSSTTGQTLLAADVHYPGHPKCVVRQLQLPTRNPMTLKFLGNLLRKKVEVLESIGQHPNIPSTFAAFEEGQTFCIVQEFIPGRSLQAELREGEPWSALAVLFFLRETLPILAFAQENGVIHGNLKPSKLIRHQKENHLVIVDFGGIKTISQHITHRGKRIADQTAAAAQVYRAPEQLHGQSHFGSDHYALGMIALQALHGISATALPQPDDANLQAAIVGLLEGVPELDAAMIAILARMVHPDPQRRYQKAQDILVDLDRLQTGDRAPLAPLSAAWIAAPTAKGSLAVTEEATSRPHRLPWGGLGIAALTGLGLIAGGLSLRVPQRLLAMRQVQKAQVEVAANNLEGAIAYYSQALALAPNRTELLAQRSHLHAKRGNTAAALADITEALEADTQNAGYAYDRANLRLTVGDVQGAIADYTQALKLDPTFVKAYVNRGSARADWGDDHGAIEDYTQAIALNPPKDVQAAAYLNRCLSYSNQGDQTRALEDCTTAINLRPSHGLAYQNRGLVRRRLGDLQGSLQDYNIAIQISPNSADAYYNRGLTRQAMADRVGAKEDLSQAIAIDPNYVFAYYDRGLLATQEGNLPQALADFRKTSQLCLDLGRTGCYQDAQYQISRLQTGNLSPPE